MAWLKHVSTEALQDPVVAEQLHQAECNPPIDPWDQANLRCMQHLHRHACSVPMDLLTDCAKLEVQCARIWRQARLESDWNMLEPSLTQLVEYVREISQHKSACLGLSPYDTLLDVYDPGARMIHIDPQFEHLDAQLPSYIQRIQAVQGDCPNLSTAMDISQQETLAKNLMVQMGFDFTKGRLDISTHPFCGGQSPDLRLTSRYDVQNPLIGMYGVIHETGHGLYEQSCPIEWLGQPVGNAAGMSLHESQSLFMEKQIGGHPTFLRRLHALLHEPDVLDPTVWTVDAMTRWVHHVKPSCIRVEADEVTYPLHIILRYRIEKALLARDIEVRHIPDLWNAQMQALLGLIPKDHRSGCLQDIHWPSGAFGYFPSYTRGALIAAQLAHGFMDEIARIGVDGLLPIRLKLKAIIHQYGSFFADAESFMQHATGENVNASYFFRHIKTRYKI